MTLSQYFGFYISESLLYASNASSL